jgi:dUTPase
MSMPQTLRFCKIRDVESPSRAHQYDAGIDFYVPADYRADGIEPGHAKKIPSGIKADVAVGMALVAFNKSGVATKHGLQVGACVVDSGYEGEIHLHVMNVRLNLIFCSRNDLSEGMAVLVAQMTSAGGTMVRSLLSGKSYECLRYQ